AVFLFLIIEGFARMIDNMVPGDQRSLARGGAILVVLTGFIGFIALMVQGISQFGGANAADYERKINLLIDDVYAFAGLGDGPSLSQLLLNERETCEGMDMAAGLCEPSGYEGLSETGQRFASEITGAVGDLSSDIVLILIYIAFMFLAQSTWSRKLDRIFPDPDQRAQATQVADDCRRGIETYLWTQTVISTLITLLTYFTLLGLGVENALFLAALIFVLNYIPTVGSIVAALVPPLFAMVQPTIPGWIPGTESQATLIYSALVFAGVSFWQFSIGNFVQPRMMGDSLNLSALVVLISLAVWGAIWGIPGMFLSAPLTVLMMVLFAQSQSTRWIAILLSANGDPQMQKGVES
ncbi:MAG: AI-2E family transporter, partial [Pseudomonadota bacterium]